MKQHANETRKVTMNLPVHLIDSLLRDEDEGLTAMVRRLLEKEKHRRACDKLKRMRGKVKFSLTYEQIKEDRE